MPELPEVETIARGLNKAVSGLKIIGVETDTPKLFKGPDFPVFKDKVTGQEILKVYRRAKNILFLLSSGQTMLIHLKLTGHILVTSDGIVVKDGRWVVDRNSPLSDPQNQFIHVVWQLSEGKKMALSDLRKFANVLLFGPDQLSAYLKGYGPEPFEADFSLSYLTEVLSKKAQPIKKVLLDQNVVAGIGNIYADEILFESRVHPLQLASSLSEGQVRSLFENIKKVLEKSIRLRGTSISDYRDINGEKGGYAPVRKVYRRTGELCPENCGGQVKRIEVGGRGTHFCPKCQVLR